MNLSSKTLKKEGSTLRVEVIYIAGEIDMHHSPELRKMIFDLLESKPNRLAIEMSQVAFLDSSGVATLIEGLKTAKSKACDFYLLHLSPQILDVFSLARLDKVFKMLENEEALFE